MYFWTGIWKYYCHILNQRPRICLVEKFVAKIKIIKFRTKNALFGYFWATIWKKLLSYLKSTSSNLPNCKFGEKTKMSKFGTKNVWFGYFWARIWKKILSYLKSAPSNLLKMSLQLIQWIFFIASAFSKGPGSAFSEGPDPGPGPLYKVCLLKWFLQLT